ncbi:MAG: monovalent cation/H+ antiporter subunit E [Rubellimicrobium sp.]|nr:monovalent cation/H+ antiporter subunit E [Rubellimicrobium sp.]
MSRLVPHPLLSLLLFLLWGVFTSFTPGQMLLGAAIALVAGRAVATVEPEPLRFRRPDLFVKLFFIVGIDIIRSNRDVVRLILSGGRHGERVSGFVPIPLTIRSEGALAGLAVIITATPGTTWVEYDSRTGVLLLHVFDLRETDDWATLVQTRYQPLLAGVFE